MPTFQVSSIDTTANSFTSTGVAAVGQPIGTVLLTGDPFRLRCAGGSLPAATPSLSQATTYYAIRVSDDAIKAAATPSDAAMGAAVDLSGSLTGSTTIEFQLPYVEPRVSAVGTQIHHEDFNFSWQAMRALHEHFTGRAQSVWSAPAAQRYTIIGAAGVEQDPDKTKVLRVGPQLRFAATRTGSNGVLYPLALPVGGVLSSLTFVYNRAGNTIALSIVAQDLDATAATSSAQVLVNDSSTTGIQAATVNLFAVDGSGHPTGAAGALTARNDRAYWLLLECAYTSGTPIVYGIGVNQ